MVNKNANRWPPGLRNGREVDRTQIPRKIDRKKKLREPMTPNYYCAKFIAPK